MLNHMFVVNNVYTGTPNVVIEYKGFSISLAFDNGFCNKAGYLTRSSMLISKDDKTVTHLFFKHLISDDGEHGETVGDVTLDMLADVKSIIDKGDIMEIKCAVCGESMGYGSENMTTICSGCLAPGTDDATVKMALGCFDRDPNTILTDEQIEFIEYAHEKRAAIAFEKEFEKGEDIF